MGPGNLQIELRSARLMMSEAGLKLFFSEPVSGPPKVNLRHRNVKMNVQKSDIATTMSPNCAKRGPGSNYSPVETTFRKRVVVVAGKGK